MKRLMMISFLLAAACSPEKKSQMQEYSDTAITHISPNLVEPTTIRARTESQESMLSSRTVLDKVKVLVPRSFKIMDADLVAIKYPLKQHAVFQVYTNEEATVNIAFEHMPNKATPQDLPAIKHVFEQQFNQPQIDFRKIEIEQINGRDFIVIEMITPAMDTEIYNLMFVTSLKGSLLMGTFNCTSKEMPEWQPIAGKILNSVEVID